MKTIFSPRLRQAGNNYAAAAAHIKSCLPLFAVHLTIHPKQRRPPRDLIFKNSPFPAPSRVEEKGAGYADAGNAYVLRQGRGSEEEG